MTEIQVRYIDGGLEQFSNNTLTQVIASIKLRKMTKAVQKISFTFNGERVILFPDSKDGRVWGYSLSYNEAINNPGRKE